MTAEIRRFYDYILYDNHALSFFSRTFVAMSDRNSVAEDVAKRLGITTTTLYMYINGDGSPKEIATKVLEVKENV